MDDFLGGLLATLILGALAFAGVFLVGLALGFGLTSAGL